MARSKEPIFETSYADLNEGSRISIVRLRQLASAMQDDHETSLWPLVLVNATTCLEWFAKSVLKQLIDYSADRINPDDRVLRDLKINYALILQANMHQFSIGDIVATGRNFSSFEDIDATLNDLMKESRPSLLARVRRPLADLLTDAFRRRPYSRKTLSRELERMFKKRNELVHGTPRHLAYENELDAYLTKRELLRFIHCALEYIRRVDSALRRFVPELHARSTRDINWNQYRRLENSNREIGKLERAIERRVSGEHLSEFHEAQRAWRLWRDKESAFQTAEWRGGTGRAAVQMGYETSFNMERLRSLEAYVRQLDRYYDPQSVE
jgi:hypothetical protein